MAYTRRSFLKMVGAGAMCLSLAHFGFDLKEAKAYATSLKIEGAKEVSTVCPFCAVCCQVIAYVKDGKLISTEGDPDFPVNEGSLCAKGAALLSMYTGEHRLTKPMYRAPYSDKWVEKDWDWTLQQIARRVKTAFEPFGKAVEVPVSLAMGWASFDGAQDRELSDTQKRDDSAMYKDKLQIKARDRENGWTCDR